jgi:hypothetical protein
MAAERPNCGTVEVVPDSTQSPADWKEGSFDRPYPDSLGQMISLFVNFGSFWSVVWVLAWMMWINGVLFVVVLHNPLAIIQVFTNQCNGEMQYNLASWRQDTNWCWSVVLEWM